jgi:hypothetical protein
MKRVLRSCLDPLPRFLSTRGVMAVVVLVVAGTAVSVHEFVESGRGPDSTWTAWPSEVRAGSCERPTLRSHSALDARADAPCTAVPPAVRRVTGTTSEPLPAPATLFDPDSGSSGS